jgi:glycosyltransferase involved in cell wall biosynthesis
MACARPVILGVDGQARKIVDEAQAGLFMEPENPDALTNAIMHLAADSELRESMGSNGARHILLHFSRQQTAKDYLAVLGSVVGEKRL